jgi:hypothetical protein
MYLSKAFDKWTRDQDYKPGRICGFWHQLKGLAKEMTCTERAIHSIELDLVKAGLVLRHPKANGSRDGLRDSEEENTLRKLFWYQLRQSLEAGCGPVNPKNLTTAARRWRRMRMDQYSVMRSSESATPQSVASIGDFGAR